MTQTAAAQQPGAASAKSNQATVKTTAATAAADVTPATGQFEAPSAEAIVTKIVASGRVLLIGETSSARLSPAVRLAPGAPPILAFRYLDGQARHRFGDLDLVMDDAGH